MPQLEKLDICKHTHPVWRYSAAVIKGQAQPTAAFRAAVWLATAVIVAASITITIYTQRHRRQARAGSTRWEAGWAGQAKGVQVAAGR
jgi:hypothetical protein